MKPGPFKYSEDCSIVNLQVRLPEISLYEGIVIFIRDPVGV